MAHHQALAEETSINLNTFNMKLFYSLFPSLASSCITLSIPMYYPSLRYSAHSVPFVFDHSTIIHQYMINYCCTFPPFCSIALHFPSLSLCTLIYFKYCRVQTMFMLLIINCQLLFVCFNIGEYFHLGLLKHRDSFGKEKIKK